MNNNTRAKEQAIKDMKNHNWEQSKEEKYKELKKYNIPILQETKQKSIIWRILKFFAN